MRPQSTIHDSSAFSGRDKVPGVHNIPDNSEALSQGATNTENSSDAVAMTTKLGDDEDRNFSPVLPFIAGQSQSNIGREFHHQRASSDHSVCSSLNFVPVSLQHIGNSPQLTIKPPTTEVLSSNEFPRDSNDSFPSSDSSLTPGLPIPKLANGNLSNPLLRASALIQSSSSTSHSRSPLDMNENVTNAPQNSTSASSFFHSSPQRPASYVLRPITSPTPISSPTTTSYPIPMSSHMSSSQTPTYPIASHSNATPLLRTLTLSSLRNTRPSESPVLRRFSPANPFSLAALPPHSNTQSSSTYENRNAPVMEAMSIHADSLRDSMQSVHTQASSVLTEPSSSFLLPHADLHQCHSLLAHAYPSTNGDPASTSYPSLLPREEDILPSSPYKDYKDLPLGTSAEDATAPLAPRAPTPLPPTYPLSWRAHSDHTSSSRRASPLPSFRPYEHSQPYQLAPDQHPSQLFAESRVSHTSASAHLPTVAQLQSAQSIRHADATHASSLTAIGPAISPVLSPTSSAVPHSPFDERSSVSSVLHFSPQTSNETELRARAVSSVSTVSSAHPASSSTRASFSLANGAPAQPLDVPPPQPVASNPVFFLGGSDSTSTASAEHGRPPVILHAYSPEKNNVHPIARQLMSNHALPFNRVRAGTTVKPPNPYRDYRDRTATVTSNTASQLSQLQPKDRQHSVSYSDAAYPSLQMLNRGSFDALQQQWNNWSLSTVNPSPQSLNETRGSTQTAPIGPFGVRESIQTSTLFNNTSVRESTFSSDLLTVRDSAHTTAPFTVRGSTAAPYSVRESVYGGSERLSGNFIVPVDGGGIASGLEIAHVLSAGVVGIRAASGPPTSSSAATSTHSNPHTTHSSSQGLNSTPHSSAPGPLRAIDEHGVSNSPPRMRLTPSNCQGDVPGPYSRTLRPPPNAPHQRFRRRLLPRPSDVENDSPSMPLRSRGMWQSPVNEADSKVVQLSSSPILSTTRSAALDIFSTNVDESAREFSLMKPQLPLATLPTNPMSPVTPFSPVPLPAPNPRYAGQLFSPSCMADVLNETIPLNQKDIEDDLFDKYPSTLKKRFSFSKTAAPSTPRCGPRESATQTNIPQVSLPPGWGGSSTQSSSPRKSVSLADVLRARETASQANASEHERMSASEKPKKSFRLLFWANASSPARDTSSSYDRVRKIRQNNVLGGLSAAALRADAVASHSRHSPLTSAADGDLAVSPTLALGLLNSESGESQSSTSTVGMADHGDLLHYTNTSHVSHHDHELVQQNTNIHRARAVFSVPLVRKNEEMHSNGLSTMHYPPSGSLLNRASLTSVLHADPNASFSEEPLSFSPASKRPTLLPTPIASTQNILSRDPTDRRDSSGPTDGRSHENRDSFAQEQMPSPLPHIALTPAQHVVGASPATAATSPFSQAFINRANLTNVSFSSNSKTRDFTTPPHSQTSSQNVFSRVKYTPERDQAYISNTSASNTSNVAWYNPNSCPQSYSSYANSPSTHTTAASSHSTLSSTGRATPPHFLSSPSVPTTSPTVNATPSLPSLPNSPPSHFSPFSTSAPTSAFTSPVSLSQSTPHKHSQKPQEYPNKRLQTHQRSGSDASVRSVNLGFHGSDTTQNIYPSFAAEEGQDF